MHRIGLLALVVLAVAVLTMSGGVIARLMGDDTAGPSPASGAIGATSPSAVSSPAAASPTAVSTGGGSPTPATTAPDRPTSAPDAGQATDAPSSASGGDPAARYRAFLDHLAGVRDDAAAGSAALVAAAEAQDLAAVEQAAVDVLDLTDQERGWLLANPPADCYVAAHAAATTMVASYATTAERALDWAGQTGLAALAALASLLDAATATAAEVEDLGTALAEAACPV
jgi:hypothetical protein